MSAPPRAARPAGGTRGRASTARARQAARPLSDGPWPAKARLFSAIVTGLGAGAMAVCWWVLSGKEQWVEQRSWMALDIAALGLAGIGMVSWLVVGFRSVHAEERLVMSVLRERRRGAMAGSPHRAARDGETRDVPVTAAGMSIYHRDGCLLMRGKPSLPVTRESGLLPCRICQP